MTEDISLDSVRRHRIYAQRLPEESGSGDVTGTIKWLGALQAQELPSAHLAIRARTKGLTVQDVRHAREIDRSIILTWSVRGTMHLIMVEDVSWQLALFGSHFIKETEKRYKQLGLDEATRDKASRQIVSLLSKHGPLTKVQLAQSLAAFRIPVERQAIYHLLRYAALRGLICFGPEEGGELTYVVLEDWLSGTTATPEHDKDLAIRELARRYFRAFGPATLADFKAWSGLSALQSKAGLNAIASELKEVRVNGDTAWMLKAVPVQPPEVSSVRLLPRYDNYLLGYQNRDFMVSAAYANAVHPGGGLIRSSVVVNGLAQAIWHLANSGKMPVITIELFNSLDAKHKQGIEREAEDIARFLQLQTGVDVDYSSS